MAPETALTNQALPELISLAGQTAIVTGGALGIGNSIVRRLHEAGANVVISDPEASRHELVAELTQTRPGSAIATHTDVSDADSVEAMAAAANDTFGGVDILVNNAGIYPAMPLLEMDPDLFRRVIDINLVGLFLCTQTVAKGMVKAGRGGKIVNITSIDALHPSMAGLSHYDSSKHGAWGFTKASALELAPHKIRVNAIAPGGITTHGTQGMDQSMISQFEAMIPMGRMGQGDEIALAALFLASDMSSYMTGSQVVIDGGRLLR